MLPTGRDISLDFTRFLGVIIIMIAHSSPPDWLHQFRNFGTPLLVIASGMTHAVIYKSREMNTKLFLQKRLPRLIFPVWIFLSFFFSFLFLMSVITGDAFQWSMNDIILSFALYKGIGFVWIFRVYIVLALITPFCIHLSKTVKNDSNLVFGLLGVYFLYELILFIFQNYFSLSESVREFINIVIFTVIPYTLLFLYGTKMIKFKDKTLILISIVFFIIFAMISTILFLQNGKFVPTQDFKYPPQIYYLSYALALVHLVYLVIRKYSYKLNTNAVIWLSSNSLWIYLWHIFTLVCWGAAFGSADGDLLKCIFQSIGVLIMAIIITLLQRNVVMFIKSKIPSEHFSQKILSLLV